MLAMLAKLPLWQKALGGALLVVLAVVAFQIWLGDQRSDAVRADRDASRAEASDAARGGLEKAMDEEAARESDFREKQHNDRKGIDDAKRTGNSPFDSMFPGNR